MASNCLTQKEVDWNTVDIVGPSNTSIGMWPAELLDISWGVGSAVQHGGFFSTLFILTIHHLVKGVPPGVSRIW
jgi:hypothetical protein